MTTQNLSSTAETLGDSPLESSGDARLLTHAYDGIREYDNPLPGWWRATFYVSIVFAIVYGVAYHVVDWGTLPDEAYRIAKVEYASKFSAEAAEIASASEEVLATGARDSAVVAKGREVFAARCASCHNTDGRGLIGPNLTDYHQLHGATRVDLFTTIRDGVPGTAMLAWGTQMPAFDIVAVATFVGTLQGQNKAGKEPQGPVVKAFAP